MFGYIDATQRTFTQRVADSSGCPLYTVHYWHLFQVWGCKTVVHSAVLASAKVCGKGTTWHVSCFTTHAVNITQIVFGTKHKHFLRIVKPCDFCCWINQCVVAVNDKQRWSKYIRSNSTVGPTIYTFVFSLLWINSLYMFPALFAHHQEALINWYRGYGATICNSHSKL
jgi:hypothetical protein